MRTVSCGNFVSCSTSSSDAPPLSTLLNPTDPTRSRYVANRGRRKSPSTRTALRPASASANARLIAVVVLPSLGCAFTTTISRGGSSTARNSRFVRSIQKSLGSATVVSIERDRVVGGEFLVEGDVADDRDASHLLENLWTLDSAVELVQKKARSTPNIAPIAMPSAMSLFFFGTAGAPGIEAR